MQPSAQEKGVNTVPSFTSCGGKRQWCLRQMAKRREGLVVQSLAELDNLPHTGGKASVLDETKTLLRQKSRSDRAEGCHRDQSSRAASEQWKMWTHEGVVMVPRKITRLILEISKYSEFSAATIPHCQKLRGTRLVP